MNETPPSLASATAKRSPETDCIIAEVIGIFIEIAGSSPFLNLTKGVLRLTFAGIHSFEEYPGISKYSLNVNDYITLEVGEKEDVKLGKAQIWTVIHGDKVEKFDIEKMSKEKDTLENLEESAATVEEALGETVENVKVCDLDGRIVNVSDLKVGMLVNVDFPLIKYHQKDGEYYLAKEIWIIKW